MTIINIYNNRKRKTPLIIYPITNLFFMPMVLSHYSKKYPKGRMEVTHA